MEDDVAEATDAPRFATRLGILLGIAHDPHEPADSDRGPNGGSVGRATVLGDVMEDAVVKHELIPRIRAKGEHVLHEEPHTG